MVRAATGAVYVALVLGAAFAGELTSVLLFLPVCAIAAAELGKLLAPPDGNNDRTLHIVAAVLMFVSHAVGYFRPGWSIDHVIGSAAVLLLIALFVQLKSGSRDPARDFGGILLALVLGASFGSIVWYFAYDRWLFIGAMLLLWTNDTGAYLVGRALGRTKLLPSVSPKKTVEGLLGGVVLTAGVALLLAQWQPVLDTAQWMICGVVVALSATLGDLFESALKRAKGVKDSGSLLPGHGGFLDRFDGFLLAVPCMLLTVRLLLGSR